MAGITFGLKKPGQNPLQTNQPAAPKPKEKTFAAPVSEDYQPKHLLPSQIRLESGGKQFDSQGRPLLGRYRDGSAPKPSEQAFGAGQIQIATARETAKRHGIPWNERRLLTDRNYNLLLADTHMGDLVTRYGGDKTLAIAAYHSGSGNVDRALREYGREGFAQGLGPEGRNYVKKLAGEGVGAIDDGSAIGTRAQPRSTNPFLAQGKASYLS